jgi:predicted ATPase
VAAGLEEEIAQSEKRCAELTRRGQFLRADGVEEWPDGTVAGRYGFIHALHQDVLYSRLTANQRLYLHRKVGERKEAAYGTKASAIAAELALHFAQGRDYHRAVRYLQHAAHNAVQRHAFQEALAHVTKGLELLSAWPPTPERTRQELLLHMTVIGPLMALRGEAAPEVERAYAQIWELHQQGGETTQPIMVVLGFWTMQVARGEHQKAQALAEQLVEMAQRRDDPLFRLWAYYALGISFFCRGEFSSAHVTLEKVEMLYNTQQQPRYMFDPKLACPRFKRFCAGHWDIPIKPFC